MRDIRELSESFEVRVLNDTDIDEVFEVYKSNPFYFQHMNIVPEKKTVLDDMKMLPRGKGMEDKFFLGFYGEEKLIAVMDLIFQYPNEKTAFIGLFMMERVHQGKGIGSKIIRETEKYLVRNGFGYIRLAFIRGNKESEGFWRKNGFFPTGVQIEQENYTMVVMEKEIKNMQTQSEQRFATESIPKLMVTMAVPSVIAQVINILYNIVDRIYIGHIEGVGAAALTGVGVTFPIITLISAFSAFVGRGGAPLAAIWMGKGDQKHAEKILGNGAFLLTAFSVLLMAVFLIWQRPLLYLFGASDATIGYACDYLTIYLLGTWFVQLALGLNPFIICQGKPRTAMFSIMIGAVINIVLDPIFIFVFGWGVRGAAIATVISQAMSAAWNVGFLVSGKSSIRLMLRNLKPESRIIGQTFSLGISPFIMSSTESLVTIVLNSGMQRYGGDLYVGSITIMQSVLQLFSAPLTGFTQGVQPIISYNYGAGNFARTKKICLSMIGVSFTISFLANMTAMVVPEFYASLFSNDPELIALVGKVMPIFLFGMLFFGLQNGIQPSFLSLGQAGISLFIAMFRKVILLVPLALILPRFFGVMGIYYAEPVSDIISAATATLLFALNINRILSKEYLERIR